MLPAIDDNLDDETSAEMWTRLAKHNRQHLAKYPDCFDRDQRLKLAEMYERFAREDQDKGE